MTTPRIFKSFSDLKHIVSENIGLTARNWHYNQGLKASYDLIDLNTKEITTYQFSIFTGGKNSLTVQNLGQYFPSEEVCTVAEKLLQLYAWSQSKEESELIKSQNLSDLIAWISIFRLPTDVIDFLKWIDKKVVFTNTDFFSKRKKCKTKWFYVPYLELYEVYRTNK